MQSLITAKWIQVTLFCLGVLIVLFSVFLVGVTVGERKSRHFEDWSRNYPGMFIEAATSVPAIDRPSPGLRIDPRRVTVPLPHGIFGTVISVSDRSLIVQGKDHIEQTIIVTNKTSLRAGPNAINLFFIKPNAQVGVFGEPNAQGQIEAKLIRLFSQP